VRWSCTVAFRRENPVQSCHVSQNWHHGEKSRGLNINTQTRGKKGQIHLYSQNTRGHRRYETSTRSNTPKTVALYARVSAYKQKNDLQTVSKFRVKNTLQSVHHTNVTILLISTSWTERDDLLIQVLQSWGFSLFFLVFNEMVHCLL